MESIDRMYLNVYVPKLQTASGAVWFFRGHRQATFASSALMAPISRAFVREIERYAQTQGIPMVPFQRGQRKDDIAQAYRAKFTSAEGVVFIGKAQDALRVRVYRTQKRLNEATGQQYPWIVSSHTPVNQYYFYCQDRDFGPFFLKFSSYFPYDAKLCLNGHAYAKRQLEQAGIAYEALDNGVLSCADPARLQAICDGLSGEKIEALLRKWLAMLPQPFSPADQAAGYGYDLSIWQAEFSLTQVLDRPLSGRVFFEQVIRENLDVGRPDQVQLIFNRRVTKRTPGHFRTRVITAGVVPSLHIDYKHTRIKQYHKEGRALRTETTINNPRDFAIGKRLCNLPALRQIGFQANRRLLDVEQVSHDGAIGEAALRHVTQPVVVAGQRASALRFGEPRTHAVLSVLVLFSLLPNGFTNHDLRSPLAALLGLDPAHLTPGRMTYELRRLRLHDLIQRIPGTYRYRLTADGLRIALFFTRTYTRVLQPGLAQAMPSSVPDSSLGRCFDQLDRAIESLIQQAHLAA
ncbi:MAG: hypothetical protein M1546_12565 [Chloroflexi bacterium]|nr:hypothetical protein [Chloroflexota bacterium]